MYETFFRELIKDVELSKSTKKILVSTEKFDPVEEREKIKSIRARNIKRSPNKYRLYDGRFFDGDFVGSCRQGGNLKDEEY